ncbi:hypothetical protein HLRTI_001609 [Halorhabdus tiamatea SARL4B]|uniref:Conserved hypothetical membrane protein (UPF0126) n=2 Tax=Halorhabdus TaxID=146825 RepID=F7PLY6_9EURY|nr:hypothetical protein HLRTI_001609 [Halorhabdus tiamatea SARL4B]CCQ34574.1 conserved hypothetical membrane protein (UPF0126) [Halorhabdus tiamatea SARL4B]
MVAAFLEQVLIDPFAVMNTIGLVAFALVGAAKGIREEFDVFGISVVGLVTAFGGGATRDVLVGRTPLALQSMGEVSLGFLGVGLALLLSVLLESPDDHPITLVADAIGLAAFATAGAIVATEAGISPFGIVTVSTINAVGGGAYADILLDRSPFILFEDFYATAAVLGGSTYWLVTVAGAAGGLTAAACAAMTVGTRLLAVTRGWHLPTAQMLGLAGDVGNSR